MNNEEFEKCFLVTLQAIAKVEGYLTDREVRCLVLLAAVPSCKGVVLEIGSFKGRSTIVLAKAASQAGEARIVAVDPLTSPSKTDPDLGGKPNTCSDFQANLKSAGVENAVEFHMERSADLARKWNPTRKIRFLWIDGDHTYPGVKMDFDLFRPFLANGAIVAMHDVLHSHSGPVRVFAEDVLCSPHFGPFGFSGSIGWSQFFESPDTSIPFRPHKLRYYRRLSRVVSLTAFGDDLHGLDYFRYKLARARMPHGDAQPDEFRRQIVSVG